MDGWMDGRTDGGACLGYPSASCCSWPATICVIDWEVRCGLTRVELSTKDDNKMHRDRGKDAEDELREDRKLVRDLCISQGYVSSLQ